MAPGTEGAIFSGASGLCAQMGSGAAETVCTVIESMSYAALLLEDKMVADFF